MSEHYSSAASSPGAMPKEQHGTGRNREDLEGHVRSSPIHAAPARIPTVVAADEARKCYNSASLDDSQQTTVAPGGDIILHDQSIMLHLQHAGDYSSEGLPENIATRPPRADIDPSSDRRFSQFPAPIFRSPQPSAPPPSQSISLSSSPSPAVAQLTDHLVTASAGSSSAVETGAMVDALAIRSSLSAAVPPRYQLMHTSDDIAATHSSAGADAEPTNSVSGGHSATISISSSMHQPYPTLFPLSSMALPHVSGVSVSQPPSLLPVPTSPATTQLSEQPGSSYDHDKIQQHERIGPPPSEGGFTRGPPADLISVGSTVAPMTTTTGGTMDPSNVSTAQCHPTSGEPLHMPIQPPTQDHATAVTVAVAAADGTALGLTERPPTPPPVDETQMKGNMPWTAEEDARLRSAVELHSQRHWKKIARHVPGRTAVQCLQHYKHVLHPDIERGSWTPEEDKEVVRLVSIYGLKWATIAKEMPRRLGKRIRERYVNHLDPGLKHGGWTAKEEVILINKCKEIGQKWSKLAKYLPGRSVNAIKNHWYAVSRGRGVLDNGYRSGLGHVQRDDACADGGHTGSNANDGEITVDSSVSVDAINAAGHTPSIPHGLEGSHGDAEGMNINAWTGVDGIEVGTSGNGGLISSDELHSVSSDQVPSASDTKDPGAGPQGRGEPAASGGMGSSSGILEAVASSPPHAHFDVKIDGIIPSADIGGGEEPKPFGQAVIGSMTSNGSETVATTDAQRNHSDAQETKLGEGTARRIPADQGNRRNFEDGQRRGSGDVSTSCVPERSVMETAGVVALTTSPPATLSLRTPSPTITSSISAVSSAGARVTVESTAATAGERGMLSPGTQNHPAAGVSPSTQRWTDEQSALLRQLVDENGPKDWPNIAKKIPPKTELQCMLHWNHVINPELTKGKGSWKPEEDQRIIEMVEQFGNKWSFIAAELKKETGKQSRVGKQIRERYLNHLDPKLKKGAWTAEEEETLVRQHGIHKNKWVQIAKALPGRCDNDIKNHWYAHQRQNREFSMAAATKRLDAPQADNLSEKVGARLAGFDDAFNRRQRTQEPLGRTEADVSQPFATTIYTSSRPRKRARIDLGREIPLPIPIPTPASTSTPMAPPSSETHMSKNLGLDNGDGSHAAAAQFEGSRQSGHVVGDNGLDNSNSGKCEYAGFGGQDGLNGSHYVGTNAGEGIDGRQDDTGTREDHRFTTVLNSDTGDAPQYGADANLGMKQYRTGEERCDTNGDGDHYVLGSNGGGNAGVQHHYEAGNDGPYVSSVGDPYDSATHVGDDFGGESSGLSSHAGPDVGQFQETVGRGDMHAVSNVVHVSGAHGYGHDGSVGEHFRSDDISVGIDKTGNRFGGEHDGSDGVGENDDDLAEWSRLHSPHD